MFFRTSKEELGVTEKEDGTFKATTNLGNKTFISREHAVRWLATQEYLPDGSYTHQSLKEANYEEV